MLVKEQRERGSTGGRGAEAGRVEGRTSVLNLSKLVCVVGRWFIRSLVRSTRSRCLTMQIMNAKYC